MDDDRASGASARLVAPTDLVLVPNECHGRRLVDARVPQEAAVSRLRATRAAPAMIRKQDVAELKHVGEGPHKVGVVVSGWYARRLGRALACCPSKWGS
jgi:hypothetical protein